MSIPEREIRAHFDIGFIRVYQAYSNEIADSALSNNRFVSPPFSFTRMTWIKPSFLWMMYRSGWAKKDPGQQRILAIDIAHEGFEWALAHSCVSHREPSVNEEAYKDALATNPVRVQWDPERDLHHSPLPYRTIQIGLSGEAVRRYANEWITRITDVTSTAHRVHGHVLAGNLDEAQLGLPEEWPYPLGMMPQKFIETERERLLQHDHFDHEAIVHRLQAVPDPASIPYLRQAIAMKPQLPYLHYDDYGSFYKKCLWALQDIATPDALALIVECSHSEVPELRNEALYRLKKIAAGGRNGSKLPATKT